MPLSSAIPYWRLSAFYFFYFALLGVLIPYWAPYLKEKGFSAEQIGELIAILLATRIVAPSVGGWIADYYGKQMMTVRLAGLASLITFAFMLSVDRFTSFALITFIFSFCWHISLPQFEAITLQHLGDKHHHYSKIRLWGSLGFIVTVVAVGIALEYTDTSIVPLIILGNMACIWIVSLIVPESSASPADKQPFAISTLLKRSDVIAFLVICLLLQFSHGPYYTFYSIYLTQNGYSATLIGGLWAFGVVAEMVVFLLMHRLLSRLGIIRILLISLLLTSVRWLLIGAFPDKLTILIAAQCLHAASFGSFHAAAIAWVHRHFAQHQGQGQGLYSSAGFGAGGAAGSVLSGYIWLSSGAQATFSIAALSTLIAFVIGWRWLK